MSTNTDPQPVTAAMPDSAEDAIERICRRIDAMPDDPPEPPPPTAPQILPFSLNGVHESVVEAHAAVKNWLSAITLRTIPAYSLTLSGRSGCGKTHLAKNAAAFLKQKGYTCALYSWSELLLRYKKDAEHTLHVCGKFHVLIIDDVGAENISGEFSRGFSAAALCAVVEKRLGKWTMLTSNLTTTEIASTYDSRVSSRLIRNGGRTVDMTAADDYSLLNPSSRQLVTAKPRVDGSANCAAADNPKS